MLSLIMYLASTLRSTYVSVSYPWRKFSAEGIKEVKVKVREVTVQCYSVLYASVSCLQVEGKQT